MDKITDRYFVLLQKDDGSAPLRFPLTNKRFMYRTFIHYLMGDFSSIQIFKEEYMDKKVLKKERKNGVLVRGNGVSMREKVVGFDHYDKLATQFREGIYDPIENGKYQAEGQCCSYFTDEQFENTIELLTLIHEGEY